MKGYRNALGQNVTPDPEEYFWNNIKKDTITGCWNWKGNMFNTGYGQFKNKRMANGRPIGASRAAWLLFRKADLKRFEFVCHRCDNPRCCNPDHLFVGTQKQNMEDCVEKVRINRGEDRPQAKLTEDDVRQMRKARQMGCPWRVIAADFHVTLNCAISAITGKTWSHVDEPIPTYIGKPGRPKVG